MNARPEAHVSVHLASAEPGILTGAPKPRRLLSRYQTYVLTANDPTMDILPQDPDRVEYTIVALDNDIMLGPTKGVVGAAVNTISTTVTLAAAGTNPTPNQPAVPATGVAQQNVNLYPVQVVISANGATISNVSVNGITVGTAAGTYTVPAFGAISIAYTVAIPTWVWSDANPVTPAVTTTVFAPNANGAYVPKQLRMVFKDTGQVYAGVTTTASNSRVTVIDTYYEVPEG